MSKKPSKTGLSQEQELDDAALANVTGGAGTTKYQIQGESIDHVIQHAGHDGDHGAGHHGHHGGHHLHHPGHTESGTGGDKGHQHQLGHEGDHKGGHHDHHTGHHTGQNEYGTGGWQQVGNNPGMPPAIKGETQDTLGEKGHHHQPGHEGDHKGGHHGHHTGHHTGPGMPPLVKGETQDQVYGEKGHHKPGHEGDHKGGHHGHHAGHHTGPGHHAGQGWDSTHMPSSPNTDEWQQVINDPAKDPTP